MRWVPCTRTAKDRNPPGADCSDYRTLVVELQAHFDEFRIVVVRQIKELQELGPGSQTTEWYLLKYMRRIHSKVVVSNSPREVENTIRALLRFYLDAVDEGSELEERCKEVLQFHRRSLRLERRH